MAKYTINTLGGEEIKVEASDYFTKDGYFWFQDGNQDNVHTIRTVDVHSVEKSDESK